MKVFFTFLKISLDRNVKKKYAYFFEKSIFTNYVFFTFAMYFHSFSCLLSFFTPVNGQEKRNFKKVHRSGRN